MINNTGWTVIHRRRDGTLRYGKLHQGFSRVSAFYVYRSKNVAFQIFNILIFITHVASTDVGWSTSMVLVVYMESSGSVTK